MKNITLAQARNAHPAIIRARAALQSGAHPAKVIADRLHQLRHHGRGTSSTDRADYAAAVAKRTANPEAKRARDDRQFRRAYLARLTRQERALIFPPQSTLAQISAAADARSTRLAALRHIQQLRGIVTGIQPPTPELAPIAGVKVALSWSDLDLCRAHGAEIIARGNAAALIATRKSTHGRHSASSTDWSGGPSKPRHVAAVHDNFVRSAALVSATDPRTVAYALHRSEIAITLPDGYAWRIDANGLHALEVSTGADYHPSARELLGQGAAAGIVAALAAGREARLLAKARIVAERAALQGVTVCLADSVRAGNCRVGSEAFAARHALDARKHYEATALLAMANGDAGRVRLAISAAVHRHHAEMVLGYALLTDHRVS